MKIRFLVLGKTHEPFFRLAEDKYISRLGHYVNFERQELPDVKHGGQLGMEQLKRKEGQTILSLTKEDDFLVLLDEKGEELNSLQFSTWLEKKFHASARRITFCIGGAFGFSEEVYQRSNAKISLSKMTFSHQLVRTIFLEQLYRACTIMKGEKYHHE